MRPEVLFPLFTPIASINGVGVKGEKLLAKLGLEKTVDLIWHFPSNIVDRTYMPSLKELEKRLNVGQNDSMHPNPPRQATPATPPMEGNYKDDLSKSILATLKLKVIEHGPPSKKGRPYRVVCEDDTGQIILSFFKVYESSIQNNLPIGQERIVSGRVEWFNGGLQMSHPDYIVRTDVKLGIEPVYPLTAGIGNKVMNKFVKQAVARIPTLPEWIEENHKKSMALPTFNEAMQKIHTPKGYHDLEPTSIYRTRLAYDELLANQLALAIVRQRVKKQKGRVLKGNGLLRKKLMENLAFALTGAQKRVLQEIYKDMDAPYRMLRLLQGDVGSGKTIVALMAMLNAIESGAQAAIMAPTEILAKQHLETIAPLAEDVGLKVELLTGKVKGKKRADILERLAEGKIDILIGTHALFVEDVAFKDLGFVVIDEQHRFGVHQRLALSNKGNKADILVMTATPIPRTLLLTAYGDMEYSKIDELPPGRKPVDTRVMPITKDKDIIAGLQRKLDEGERAYWVCPLVEESEKVDLQAAVVRFEMLQKVFGKDVGLIHGKMKEKEKDEVMGRFKSGELKLLVATTVIEVGVNVPEATIMVVEHAERFGLAQLHQLRGRIKRGIKDSSCLLLYSYPLSETSQARLNIMKKTEDGFVIAEEDLELRGGGEILGTRQSGFAEFKLADLSVHKGLLLTASRDAKMIMEMDENLSSERGKALRVLLYLFERDDAVKTYLAG